MSKRAAAVVVVLLEGELRCGRRACVCAASNGRKNDSEENDMSRWRMGRRERWRGGRCQRW